MILQLLKKTRKFLLPHWTDLSNKIYKVEHSKKILQIGSGLSKIKNTITIDINSATKPDIVWDLNKIPWPLENNSIDGVIAMNIVEHLDDTTSIMKEIHRVSKKNSVINILVPHFSDVAAFIDPTHKSYFGSRTFDYFISGTELENEFGFYNEARFELINKYIEVSTFWRYFPFILYLVRTFPNTWEKYFCYVIRGDALFFRLKVVK